MLFRSPTADNSYRRCLLALAVQLGWEVETLDVDAAFLQANVHHEIYIRPPEGYPCEPGDVLRLNRSLYGIKQAAREFYDLLRSVLEGIEFVCSLSDKCIFFWHSPDGVVVIVVHVDDLLLLASSKELMEVTKRRISAHFEIGRAHV